MTFSINRNERFLVGLAAYIALLCALVIPYEAAAQIDAKPVAARLVSTLPLKAEARPRWGQFSPADPRLILLDVDGDGLVFSSTRLAMRNVGAGLLPVGWLGPCIVVRDGGGRFQVLDPASLTPTRNPSSGIVNLPWPLGKDRILRFEKAGPEVGRTDPQPANVASSGLVLRETTADFAVVSAGSGYHIVDERGQVLIRSTKKVYGLTPSRDRQKLLVYYGDTDYVVFDRLAKRTTNLPKGIEAWSWSSDGATLVGLVHHSTGTHREDVTSSELFVYDLAASQLAKVELPTSIRGAKLNILDAAGPRILIEAERRVPREQYLGVLVIELM